MRTHSRSFRFASASSSSALNTSIGTFLRPAPPPSPRRLAPHLTHNTSTSRARRPRVNLPCGD
eukprot:1556871-Rhodomonas_salina.1